MPIDSVEPEMLAFLSAVIGVELSENLELEALNVIGNFVVDVGQIMLTIAAARQAREAAQEKAKAEAEEIKAKVEKEKEKAGEEKPGKAAEAAEAAAEAEEKAAGDGILVGRERERALLRRLEALERQVAVLSAKSG